MRGAVHLVELPQALVEAAVEPLVGAQAMDVVVPGATTTTTNNNNTNNTNTMHNSNITTSLILKIITIVVVISIATCSRKNNIHGMGTTCRCPMPWMSLFLERGTCS